jgi:hypothetical protein
MTFWKDELQRDLEAQIAAAAAALARRDEKDSVRVATAAALPANTRTGNVLTRTGNGALPAIDGITLAAADRLLVKDEALGANNGIYVVTSLGSAGSPWVLTRAEDADASDEVTAGMFLVVEEGATYEESIFQLATNNPIVLNTTALTFTELSSGAPVIHALGGANHSASLLAELEAKISDFGLQGVTKAPPTTTVDATATTVTTIPLADNSVYEIIAEASARRTDVADRAGMIRIGLFYRAGAGAVQQGSTNTPFSEGNSNPNVTFAVSGNNVLVQVTGVAAQTWNWAATTRYTRVS